MLESFILSLPPVFQGLTATVLFILYILAPIYIPLLFGYILVNLWLGYKRFDFITKQERILLELKLPQEIKKTPLATELFLGAVHQAGGESTWYDRNIIHQGRFWTR